MHKGSKYYTMCLINSHLALQGEDQQVAAEVPNTVEEVVGTAAAEIPGQRSQIIRVL